MHKLPIAFSCELCNTQSMEKTQLSDLLKERGMNLSGLARLVGIDRSGATRWARNKIPAERVLEVEKATGIARHHLRPDIYPLEAA